MTTSLEEKIKYYDDEYRAGRALITDKKFDQLERNLLRIDPKCDYFTNKKSLPLPSLAKENLEEFLEGLLSNTRIIVEPKIDDCALAISYKEGKLNKAITRKGKDVSEKSKQSKQYPKDSLLDQVLWFVENYLPQKKNRASRKELRLDTLETETLN